MAFHSYFYDSINGDKPYSSRDFAKAFGILTENGVLISEANDDELGFQIGGTNNTVITKGKAMVNGRFIEMDEDEILVIPEGNYDGQIVINVDIEQEREASLLVKTDRNPIQSSALFQLPLYNVTVTNGIIVSAVDIKHRGGAIPNNHTQPISSITGLQSFISNAVTWSLDTNGIKAYMGKYGGTGKPVVLYLTSSQPSPNPGEHRVWIQIDNF
jgi:hypothetical protein